MGLEREMRCTKCGATFRTVLPTRELCMACLAEAQRVRDAQDREAGRRRREANQRSGQMRKSGREVKAGGRAEEQCLCGNLGADHVAGYLECTRCRQSTDGRFRCEPGTCDRFTWTPPKRPEPPANVPLTRTELEELNTCPTWARAE